MRDSRHCRVTADEDCVVRGQTPRILSLYFRSIKIMNTRTDDQYLNVPHLLMILIHNLVKNELLMREDRNERISPGFFYDFFKEPNKEDIEHI